jgi:hypothetical protein
VTRKPSGPTGRMKMEKGPTGTRDTQAMGPIGRMEMEKGVVRSHKSDM